MESEPSCKEGSGFCSNNRSRPPTVWGAVARQRNPVHRSVASEWHRPEGPATAGEPGTAKEISLTYPLGEISWAMAGLAWTQRTKGAECHHSTTDSSGRTLNLSIIHEPRSLKSRARQRL